MICFLIFLGVGCLVGCGIVYAVCQALRGFFACLYWLFGGWRD